MSDLLMTILSHGAAFVVGGLAVSVWLKMTDKIAGDEE